MEPKKIYQEYNYHVEDGEFSVDFDDKKLLGDEGDIIKVFTDRSGEIEDEIYILFIDGDYVECIGNIDRSFPINWNEHMEVRKRTQELRKVNNEEEDCF